MLCSFQNLILILAVFQKSVAKSVELLCVSNDIQNSNVFFMTEERLVSFRSFIIVITY